MRLERRAAPVLQGVGITRAMALSRTFVSWGQMGVVLEYMPVDAKNTAQRW
jgi:hypothetical protein